MITRRWPWRSRPKCDKPPGSPFRFQRRRRGHRQRRKRISLPPWKNRGRRRRENESGSIQEEFMALNDLLKMTFERKASDLHLKVGVPPILRIDGRLNPIETEKRLTQEDALSTALGIMTPAQKTKFMEKNE